MQIAGPTNARTREDIQVQIIRTTAKLPPDHRNPRPARRRQDDVGAELSRSRFLCRLKTVARADWKSKPLGCVRPSPVLSRRSWASRQRDHEYQTAVFDSLDKLEPLILAALCAERGYASIESPGLRQRLGRGGQMVARFPARLRVAAPHPRHDHRADRAQRDHHHQ